jgi:hypothetical protein
VDPRVCRCTVFVVQVPLPLRMAPNHMRVQNDSQSSSETATIVLNL